jgi:hypothetical protein
MCRCEQAKYGLGFEVNIRVNEHEMIRLCFVHEARHGEVPSSVHERFVLGRIEHEVNAVRETHALQLEHRFNVILETHAAVTRGA